MTRYLKTSLIFLALCLCIVAGKAAHAGVQTLTQMTAYPCSGATCTAPAGLTAGQYYSLASSAAGKNINVGVVCGANTGTWWVLGYNGFQWWPISTIVLDFSDTTNYPGGRSFIRLTPGIWPQALAVYRATGSCSPTRVEIQTDVAR